MAGVRMASAFRQVVARLVLVGATAAVALVVVVPGASGAGAPACRRTFTTGAVDVPIPDRDSVFSEIDVPDDGLVVADLDVSVDIEHRVVDDLELHLIALGDDGSSRAANQLFDHDGSPVTGAGLRGTTFDDEATTQISWGDPPFTGSFRPTRPLATHDGTSGGRYDLQVTDTVADDAGVLDGWSLAVTYRACDFDADGVEDHVDQCRGVTARTASGCPPTSRSLGASYRAGAFRGVLSSRVRGCEARTPVSVFRARSGRDARVGTTRTRSDGSWRLPRAKRPGRYYATAPRAVAPGIAECPAVRSRTFRIR